MGFELVGKVWDCVSFKTYIQEVNLSWADSVTIHHTASPTLAQRPKGWTIQHMRNLLHYYKNQLGWKSAPQLFTDEDEIYGLSSLYRPGVHAVSYNSNSIGIEMLGNYDIEDPSTGRGLKVLQNTAELVAIILDKMGKPVDNESVHFHRDDPKTRKSCPGKLIDKDSFLEMVRWYSQVPSAPVLSIEERISRIEEHLKLT